MTRGTNQLVVCLPKHRFPYAQVLWLTSDMSDIIFLLHFQRTFYYLPRLNVDIVGKGSGGNGRFTT